MNILVENKDLCYLLIQLIVLFLSYIAGKYIAPKFSQGVITKLQYIMNWVDFFVREATTFDEKTGSEKKKYVSEQIILLLEKINVKLTEEEISALIESAYLKYKEGKQSSELERK